MEPQGAHGRLTVSELLAEAGVTDAGERLGEVAESGVTEVTELGWHGIAEKLDFNQQYAMFDLLGQHDPTLADQVGEWLGIAGADSSGEDTLRDVALEAQVPIEALEQAAAQAQDVQMLDVPFAYLPADVLAKIVTFLPQDDGVAVLNNLVKISSQSQALQQLLGHPDFIEPITAEKTLQPHDRPGKGEFIWEKEGRQNVKHMLGDAHHVYTQMDLHAALDSQTPSEWLAVHFPLPEGDQDVLKMCLHNGSLKRLDLYAGAALDTVNTGTVNVYEGGTITTVEDGDVSIQEGGTVASVQGGNVDVHAGGTVTSVTGGNIGIKGGTITGVTGGKITFSGGTIQLGEGIRLESASDRTSLYTDDRRLVIKGWNMGKIPILAADGSQANPLFQG